MGRCERIPTLAKLHTSKVTEMALISSNRSKALTRFSLVKTLPPSEGTAITKFSRPSFGKNERYVAYCAPACKHFTSSDGTEKGKARLRD